MGFLSPLSLAWLGLLAPLVALYVLRRRRRVRIVGSVELWSRAVQDMRAERPWQRLVPQIPLLLQATALVLGALALARPSGIGQLPAGARVAVVVDASASMATLTQSGASRLEMARRLAEGIATSIPPSGAFMLVEAASEPTVLVPPTAERGAIARGIAQLRIRSTEAALQRAVNLAAERMRDAPPGSRIVVVTDGASDAEVALGASVPVEVQRVGDDAENAGIIALDVRPRRREEFPDRAEIFVRAVHHGRSPVTRWVIASVAGRGVVASRRVELAPGRPQSVLMTADLPPDEDGRAPYVRVELATSEDTAGSTRVDALPLDDVVVVPSPGTHRLPVFLVGEPPRSVRRALVADGHVEIFEISLASFEARLADPTQDPIEGLLVFAARVPREPPQGEALVVAPSDDEVFGVALGPEVADARVVTWDENDPRLRFVDFGNVHVAALRPILGAAARPLAEADRGVLVAAVAHPLGEATIVSFDPDASDWPQSPSFVVFTRNVLERARSRRAEGSIPAGRIGEPLRVPAPDGSSVEVRCPDGSTVRGLSRGGLANIDVPALAGTFEARVGSRTILAVRNLLSPAESNPSPRARFVSREGSSAVRAVEARPHLEAWPWLATAMLIMLALEATWASRRGAS